MKLFPETRRSGGLAEVLAVWLALAVCLPVMSGLISGAGWPRLSEILFGVAALVLLSAATSVAALVWFGRLRLDNALAATVPILLFAGAASLLLDLTDWWNDGSAYLVLRSGEAVSSVLTLGLTPFRSGPTALIRFWPLLVALGLIWRLRPHKLPAMRSVVAAVSAYLALAVSVHALSWIAAAVAISRKISYLDLSDVYRSLVSAQSGGYWIAGQGERLFAPLGRQAETGLAAAQSAVWFLAACLLLAAFAAFWPAAAKLSKRLLTLEVLSSFSAAATGLGVGTVRVLADGSYTYWLSFFVLVAAMVAWVWRERLNRDLENLPDDELRRPHLPLPSGAVAPHEIEAFNLMLAVVAFFGAALLGWTVLAGFVLAECTAWLRSRRGLGWGGAVVSSALAQSLAGFSLGVSGLAFGLRSFAVAPWQVAAVSAAALLCAGFDVLRRLDGDAVRRPMRVFVPTGISVLALAVLRQPAVWGFGLLAALAQVLVGWRADWYARFRFLPGLLLLMTIAILALAWPVLWRVF